ncbi:histidine kinase dimerization/phosphoacceptor domain -containing protein [Sphingobium sp. H39-3-25]|uniref:sensor histidine kinase n=1 Tax=Sphingobium arseniciresistens TaxID=3030834 RepID=UPI0023B9457D|nr:histidine kinase dimerization/phosphoacceptor domain -containing protein [Sphingobium arseniciresistens]
MKGALGTELVEDPQDMDRPARYLALIAQVAGKLLAARDPAIMVDELFLLIQRELRLDVFFNYRFANGRLELEAHGGLTESEAAAGATLEIGQAVCGCAARDRARIHATRVQQSDEPLVAFVRDVGLNAYACTPLVQGDTLLGTLGFGRRWAERFEDDELHFLHSICDYVALAKHRLRQERILREALEAKEALLEELNHRVRNSLQLVVGLLSLEANSTSQVDPRRAIRQAADRILVMAAVHQRLYVGGVLGDVAIGGLLTELVSGVLEGHERASVVDADAVSLPVEATVALAIAFDELLRACLAGRIDRESHVQICIASEEGGRIDLNCRIAGRTGAEPVSEPQPNEKVMGAVLRQLRASVQWHDRPMDGFTLSMTRPGARG